MSKVTSADPNVVTQETVAANGQAADIVQFKKYDNTVVFKVDKDGVFTEPGYNEPVDYLIWYDSLAALYKVKDCLTNKIIHSNASYTTVVTDLETTIGSLVKSVLDKASPGGYGEQRWLYADGIPQMSEFCVPSRPDWRPNMPISAFDEGYGIIWTATAGHYGDDTANFKFGTKGIWIHAHTAPDRLTGTFSPVLDLSGEGMFVLRFYCAEVAKFDQFHIYAVSAGGNKAIWVGIPVIHKYGTYFEIHFLKEGFAEPSGTLDWSAVSQIVIDSYGVSDTTITLDFIAFHRPRNTKPIIVMGFDDDAGAKTIALQQSLSRYGWKGYLAWTSNNLTNLTKIRTLVEHGWDIIYHGAQHDIYLGTMTEKILQKDVVQWFRAAKCFGFLGGWHIAASPGGSTNWDMHKVFNRYFHAHRSAGSYLPEYFPFPSGMYMMAMDWGAYTYAQLTADIDGIESSMKTKIVYFHESTALTTTEINNLVDYIATKNIEVLNFSELLSRYAAPTRTSAGSATILNTQSTVIVPHGMRITPSIIVVEPGDTETKTYWITAVGKDKFTINLPAVVTADRTVKWRVWV